MVLHAPSFSFEMPVPHCGHGLTCSGSARSCGLEMRTPSMRVTRHGPGCQWFWQSAQKDEAQAGQAMRGHAMRSSGARHAYGQSGVGHCRASPSPASHSRSSDDSYRSSSAAAL